ncbi:MAG: hypothetical protein AB7E74_08820 [Pirellulales bacterium]
MLALYDSASRSSDGSWMCRHPELDYRVLDAFYYGVVSPRLELKTAAKTMTFATVNDEWCCWYRKYNAGRDTFDRPGRFLIAAVFLRRAEIVGVDSTAVSSLEFFRDVALAADQATPMPAPANLAATVDAEVVESASFDIGSVPGETSMEPRGEDAVRAAAIACSRLLPPAHWRLELRGIGDDQQVKGHLMISPERDASQALDARIPDASRDQPLTVGTGRRKRLIRLASAVALIVAVTAAGAVAAYFVLERLNIHN